MGRKREKREKDPIRFLNPFPLFRPSSKTPYGFKFVLIRVERPPRGEPARDGRLAKDETKSGTQPSHILPLIFLSPRSCPKDPAPHAFRGRVRVGGRGRFQNGLKSELRTASPSATVNSRQRGEDMDLIRSWITFVPDRPGHDCRRPQNPVRHRLETRVRL